MEAAVRVLLVAEVTEIPCFGIPFHARNGGLEWGAGSFY